MSSGRRKCRPIGLHTYKSIGKILFGGNKKNERQCSTKSKNDAAPFCIDVGLYRCFNGFHRPADYTIRFADLTHSIGETFQAVIAFDSAIGLHLVRP